MPGNRIKPLESPTLSPTDFGLSHFMPFLKPTVDESENTESPRCFKVEALFVERQNGRVSQNDFTAAGTLKSELWELEQTENDG